jgi:hypothetical protein
VPVPELPEPLPLDPPVVVPVVPPPVVPVVPPPEIPPAEPPPVEPVDVAPPLVALDPPVPVTGPGPGSLELAGVALTTLGSALDPPHPTTAPASAMTSASERPAVVRDQEVCAAARSVRLMYGLLPACLSACPFRGNEPLATT